MSDGDLCPGPVVIDNGTGVCKAGFAGDTDPKLSLRTLTAREPLEDDTSSPYRRTTLCKRTNETRVGDDITDHSGHMTKTYPMSRGVVTNWDHMEKIWWYIYRRLNTSPTDTPVLIAEPPLNPKSNREKAAEVFFEKFQVPSFHITLDTMLALHGTGRTSGVVACCGEGVTSVAAMFDGYCFPRSVLRQDQGGLDISLYLGHLLSQKGQHLTATTSGREILRSMKEKTAYVSADPRLENNMEAGTNMESGRGQTVTYTLPDGQRVEVGEERYLCAETLFQPSSRGLEWVSVPALIQDSVQQADMDSRRDLYRNVVLTGGTARMPGFEERVTSELEKLVPSTLKLSTFSPSNRQHSVWCGGAATAAMSTFSQLLITKQEYEEQGASVVHARCCSCT